MVEYSFYQVKMTLYIVLIFNNYWQSQMKKAKDEPVKVNATQMTKTLIKPMINNHCIQDMNNQ